MTYQHPHPYFFKHPSLYSLLSRAWVYDAGKGLDLNSAIHLAYGIEESADKSSCIGAYINIMRHLLLIPASPCPLSSNMWKLIEMFVHQVVLLKDVAHKDIANMGASDFKIAFDTKINSMKDEQKCQATEGLLHTLSLLFPVLTTVSTSPYYQDRSNSFSGVNETIDPHDIPFFNSSAPSKMNGTWLSPLLVFSPVLSTLPPATLMLSPSPFSIPLAESSLPLSPAISPLRSPPASTHAKSPQSPSLSSISCFKDTKLLFTPPSSPLPSRKLTSPPHPPIINPSSPALPNPQVPNATSPSLLPSYDNSKVPLTSHPPASATISHSPLFPSVSRLPHSPTISHPPLPPLISRPPSSPQISRSPPTSQPPPPPPPLLKKKAAASSAKPTMKRLNWVKLATSQISGTIFQEHIMKQSSKRLTVDVTTLEQKFALKSPSILHSTSPSPQRNKPVSLLDSKKAQNLGILLTSIRAPYSEVHRFILSLDPTLSAVLSVANIISLLKLLPTDDESILLHAHKGKIVDKPEAFLMEIMDIPALRARLEAFIFKADFEGQILDICRTLENCEITLAEIRSSESLKIFLYFVLDTGNVMNKGYNDQNGGGAQGFKLSSILRLRDSKTADNKSNLLEYLVNCLSQFAPTVIAMEPNEMPTLKHGKREYKKNSMEVLKTMKAQLRNLESALSSYEPVDKSDGFPSYHKFCAQAKLQMDALAQRMDDLKANFCETARFFGEDEREDLPATLVEFFAMLEIASS